MGSAMITVRGRLQIEGKVIHIVSERIEDSTSLLRQVGEMDFPHHTGRGDGATHGGSPDRGELIRVKTRDFHETYLLPKIAGSCVLAQFAAPIT